MSVGFRAQGSYSRVREFRELQLRRQSTLNPQLETPTPFTPHPPPPPRHHGKSRGGLAVSGHRTERCLRPASGRLCPAPRRNLSRAQVLGRQAFGASGTPGSGQGRVQDFGDGWCSGFRVPKAACHVYALKQENILFG